MEVSYPDFSYIEKQVRKKVFGVFNTIDPQNRPHSTGIVFAIPPPDYGFAIYMITGKRAMKVKNILQNSATSLVVTFPHYYIRFAPTFYVMFRGTSEILSVDNEIFRISFSQKMVTRKALKDDLRESIDNCVIKFTPEPTVFCFGLGISPLKILKNPGIARYKVSIPKQRLA